MKIKLTLLFVAFSMSLFSWAQPPQANNGKPSGLELVPEGSSSKAVDPSTLPSDMIIDQPAGTLHSDLYRSCKGFWVYQGLTYYTSFDGSTNVVEGNDGFVYLENPISAYAPGTWIKGKRALNDTIEFSFPQLLYSAIDDNGTPEKRYIFLMQLSDVTVNGKPAKTYTVDETGQTVKYVWRNDSLRLVSKGLLGLTNETGRWMGYGDDVSLFVDLGKLSVKPQHPENAQPCALVHILWGRNPDVRMLKTIKEGNIRYFSGWADGLADKWVKATETNGQLVFPPVQYLGKDASVNNHIFFCKMGEEKVWNSQWNEYVDSAYIDHTVPLTMDLVQGDTLKCPSTILINIGSSDINTLTYYEKLYIIPWQDKAYTPKPPVINAFNIKAPETGLAGIDFDVVPFAVSGEPLDKTKMAFCLYLDDSKYTFTKANFPSLKENTQYIPVDYADNDKFVVYGNEHIMSFVGSNFSKVGVQMVYSHGDSRQSSDIAWFTPSAISTSVANSAVVGEVYYDLQGQKISKPSKGVYIKSVTFENGTTQTTKVLIP